MEDTPITAREARMMIRKSEAALGDKHRRFRWFSAYQESVGLIVERIGAGEMPALVADASDLLNDLRGTVTDDQVRRTGARLLFVLASVAHHHGLSLAAFANLLPGVEATLDDLPAGEEGAEP